MTATDCLATPDAVALLATLDAGDDSALPYLADLLEEAGDDRAAGLRLTDGPPVDCGADGWGWTTTEIGDGLARPVLGATVSRHVWAALLRGKGHTDTAVGGAWHLAYPSRSAALLALAVALTSGRVGGR